MKSSLLVIFKIYIRIAFWSTSLLPSLSARVAICPRLVEGFMGLPSSLGQGGAWGSVPSAAPLFFTRRELLAQSLVHSSHSVNITLLALSLFESLIWVLMPRLGASPFTYWSDFHNNSTRQALFSSFDTRVN